MYKVESTFYFFLTNIVRFFFVMVSYSSFITSFFQGIMERFPANSIQEPTAFMSQDPMELYNNILVFIVTNSNQSHPPEMHIFQVRPINCRRFDYKMLFLKNQMLLIAVLIEQLMHYFNSFCKLSLRNVMFQK